MERKERALYLWRTLLTAHLTSDTPTPEMLLRTLSLCPGLAFRSRATCDGHPRKNGWPSFFIGAKGEKALSGSSFSIVPNIDPNTAGVTRAA